MIVFEYFCENKDLFSHYVTAKATHEVHIHAHVHIHIHVLCIYCGATYMY